MFGIVCKYVSMGIWECGGYECVSMENVNTCTCIYRQTLFKCEINANCEFFYNSQLLESQLNSDLIHVLYISTHLQLLELQLRLKSQVAIINFCYALILYSILRYVSLEDVNLE